MASVSSAAPRVAADFLRLAQGYLARHGVATPRLDAEVLLASVLGISRLELYARLDEPLERHEVDAYRDALRRRAAREPLAYIVGYREFYGLRMRVGPGVLIPRPETEYLVELALSSTEQAAPVRVADACTGSGAVAVAIAVRRPQACVVGTDVSEQALAFAAVNGRAHVPGGRVRWIRADGLRALAEASFDLVVSNPPYVPSGEMRALAPEIRHYEPREALDGGEDGLRTARELAREAMKVLRPGGVLIMELGTPAQARRLAAECLRAGGAYREAVAAEDPVSRVPALVARRAGEAPPGIRWPVDGGRAWP